MSGTQRLTTQRLPMRFQFPNPFRRRRPVREVVLTDGVAEATVAQQCWLWLEKLTPASALRVAGYLQAVAEERHEQFEAFEREQS
jgi:hypothetical protein